MSDKCGFCDHKTETNMLVLGDQWLEFCPPCGDTEVLTNAQTGEVASIKAVFDNIADGSPIVTRPAPPAPPAPVLEGIFVDGVPLTEREATDIYEDDYYGKDYYDY